MGAVERPRQASAIGKRTPEVSGFAASRNSSTAYLGLHGVRQVYGGWVLQHAVIPAVKLEASGLSADMVKSHFGALIKQQAALLALNDAFLLAGFVFLGLAAGSSHPRRVRNPRARIKGVPRRGIDAAMMRRSQPQKWLTFGSCIGFLLLFAGCASMPNGRCFSGSHSSTDGGSKNPVSRSIVRKLLIGQTPRESMR